MDARPIGVFDSGVGGLTVFRALAQALPDEALVYLGDTARVPYGPKSPETVRRYAREASRFLTRQGVKMMVVACNTVSSVAMEAMEKGAGVPVLGVILPGAQRAVEASRRGRIGVIGTRATVASEAYARAIHALKPGAEVVSRACPLLVPLAEEGWTDNEVARKVAEAYLAPLREAQVDTLVLGCTHYPLLRGVLQETMGSQVVLVDSAESVASEVRRRLAEDRQLAHGPGGSAPRFFVTDAPGPFLDVARRFLGGAIEHLERAELEALPAW